MIFSSDASLPQLVAYSPVIEASRGHKGCHTWRFFSSATLRGGCIQAVPPTLDRSVPRANNPSTCARYQSLTPSSADADALSRWLRPGSAARHRARTPRGARSVRHCCRREPGWSAAVPAPGGSWPLRGARPLVSPYTYNAAAVSLLSFARRQFRCRALPRLAERALPPTESRRVGAVAHRATGRPSGRTWRRRCAASARRRRWPGRSRVGRSAA
jgi:hypothetical protein